MIGQVVRSKPGGRAAAVAWFLAAAFCCGLAALNADAHWAVFALLPFCLGVAALASADAPVVFRVEDDALVFDDADETVVKYADLRGLSGRVANGGNDFAIQVYTAKRVVRIPPRLSQPSHRLYKFLLERLPWRGTPDGGPVPAKLQEHVLKQVELFGVDKVYVFRARPHPPVVIRRRHIGYSAAVAAAGVLWALAGAALEMAKEPGGGWITTGIFFALMGGANAAANAGYKFGGYRRPSGAVEHLAAVYDHAEKALATSTPRQEPWQDACFVVSPSGIALLQGPLRGKMRWDELHAIDYPARAQFGGGTGGLGLAVAGAYLVVADFYDRPLVQIEDCLREYWRGRHAN